MSKREEQDVTNLYSLNIGSKRFKSVKNVVIGKINRFSSIDVNDKVNLKKN